MSFPRYPNYKPSGVEWLGEVPEHWEMKRVKRIASIRYGIGEPPRYYEEGTPLIRATNVNAGTLCPEGLVFVDPREIPEQRIVWLTAGDIIIVRSGAYTGDSAIIPHGFGPAIAGFDMILKCYAAHARFIQFALLSKYLKDGQLDLEKMRAAQPHLNAEELGSCVVVLPNLQEQNSISAFLMNETAKIDALVAEQQRLIELLKEKRQAVISHAVTKGLDPTVPMKPSGIEWLGDIPAHWSLVRIKHLACSIEQGWSPQCEGFPVEADTEWGVLKVGCVNGGIFNPLENKALPPELEPVPSLSISVGDLLVSRANTRELVGSAAVPQSDHPNLLLCDKIYRIKLRKERILPEFVSYYLGCTPVRGQIELSATGASSSMVNIGQSVILELFVAIPSIEEQSQILGSIQYEIVKLDTLTADAERAIELLQERRTALISAAVTGQIDVRQLAQGVAA